MSKIICRCGLFDVKYLLYGWDVWEDVREYDSILFVWIYCIFDRFNIKWMNKELCKMKIIIER